MLLSRELKDTEHTSVWIIDEFSNKKVSVETKKDQVSLSQTSKIKASIQGNSKIVSDVRYDLINKYREKLDSGAYVVKAEELADKIVQKIRENKNRIVMWLNKSILMFI